MLTWEEAGARTSGFTTLDRKIIDSAVEAAQGVEGALTRDELHDLVDEVISLSSRRHRSYFHRGFFEALFSDAQPDLAQAEMNDARRAWQLCGYLVGCVRRQKWDAMERAMGEHEGAIRHLASGTHEASGIAAPIVFDRVLESSGLPAAARLVQPAAVLAAGPAFAKRVLDEGIRLLRAGQIEEAAPALEMLDVAVKLDAAGIIGLATRREQRRRMGQLHRRRGGFDRAAAIFEKMLEEDLPEWMKRRTLADIGLCRARCRALGELRVPTDPGAKAGTAKALAAGETEFQAAALADLRTGGHGEYCLGILCLLRGKHQESKPLFQRAVAEMSADEGTYALDGVLPRARLYLAMATLASSPSSAAALTVEGHLRAALEAIPDEVKAVLAEVLLGLAIADAEKAAGFAADAFARIGDPVLDAAEQAEILSKLPQLRAVLLERALTEGPPAGRRFDDAEKVLASSRDANDLDRARAAFDVLEDLAQRTKEERARFLDLTSDIEKWEQVWDPHEVRFAQVPLLIQDGRSVDAGNVLIAGARDLVARRDDASIDLARDAIEWAGWLGVQATSDLLRVVEAAPRAASPGKKPFGRVLFIGGNETQQRYDAYLTEEVKARWPDVTLTTLYTGWSSNWGRDVAMVESRIQSAGAVVLMRFMRTMLGRRVRGLCSQHGRPWVACTGHGRESMLRSIERAIAMLPSKG